MHVWITRGWGKHLELYKNWLRCNGKILDYGYIFKNKNSIYIIVLLHECRRTLRYKVRM